MINKKWFVKRLQERDKSLRALARFMHLDPSAVTHVLNNERRLQLDEAQQIADFLMVPIDEVLRNAGVKLQGAASHTGKLVGIVDDAGLIHPLEPVAITAPSSGLSALQVQPSRLFLDGAILFFKEGATVRPEFALNQLALIDQGERKSIGVLRRGVADGRYTIDQFTSEQRFQPVIAATPIAWIKP